MTVLEEDDEPPEEGEHITFVDTITKAEARWTNRKPKREYLVITLGHRRPKVTATFFNAKYLKKRLVEGTRVMLSGEVGYYKGTMQLTHPAFLILDGPGKGTRSLAKIAETSSDRAARFCSRRSSATSSRSIRPAPSCRAGTSTPACARCSTCSTPWPIRCRNLFCGTESDVGGRGASRDPPVGERAERDRARERLAFDEAAGLQWALV